MEKATEREDNKKRISFLLKFIRRKKEKIPLQKKKNRVEQSRTSYILAKSFSLSLEKEQKRNSGGFSNNCGGRRPPWAVISRR